MNGSSGSVVLDTGALIAVERDDAVVRRALRSASAEGVRVVIPSTVVAQAWRDGRRQARIARVVTDADVPFLDVVTARAVGRLLARTGTADVVDGHVALCALERRAPVVTSDPGDLARLAPGIPLIIV